MTNRCFDRRLNACKAEPDDKQLNLTRLTVRHRVKVGSFYPNSCQHAALLVGSRRE